MHAQPQLVWRAQLVVALGAIAMLPIVAILIGVSFRTGPAPVPAAPEPDIGVRLLRSASEIRLSAPLNILIGADGDLQPVMTPVRIHIDDGAWHVRTGRDDVVSWPRELTIVIRSEDGPLDIAGLGECADDLRLVPRSDDPSRFDVVGSLPLETYVAGVISAETYDGWDEEALKAQGVAARSYAISERNRARGTRRSYDIDAGHAAQALSLTPRDDAIRAARATRGVVLTSDGRVLRAYYSSTCGGRAASARDNWAGSHNSAAPLRAGPRTFHCQGSPLFLWQVTRPADALQSRLAAWGAERGHPIADIGPLRSIDVLEVNDAGRPRQYAVADTTGQVIRIGAESMRLACNQRLDGARPEDPVHSNDLAFTIRRDVVTIDGRGFGHGVGLCQFGAATLASSGTGWRPILELYYPGAELARAYE